KTIEAFLGRRVTTHAFRHAAGSSIAKENPDHVGIVPSILGHADYRTSEGYYIVADEMAAFNRFHKALDQLMRDGLPGHDPRDAKMTETTATHGFKTVRRKAFHASVIGAILFDKGA